MNPQVEVANDNIAPEGGELLADAKNKVESQGVIEETQGVQVSVWESIFGQVHPGLKVQLLEQKRAALEAANDNTAIKEAA